MFKKMCSGYSCGGVGLKTVTQVLMWGLESFPCCGSLVPSHALKTLLPPAAVAVCDCLSQPAQAHLQLCKEQHNIPQPLTEATADKGKRDLSKDCHLDFFFKHSFLFHSSLPLKQ